MDQPSPGQIIAGKYRLERPLASGGMGSVWVARHIELDTDVAIKFIASVASTEARTRFQREAKAAARIKSPHVVHVQDYGVDGDTPYIVMELLPGENLADRLKRQQRLSLEHALNVLIQVAKALRKTHDQGIVHRDLKPGNIFIVRSDEDEEIIKVVDFGIAKGIGPGDGEVTATGNALGSPTYMSPEQVRAVKDIDARSDLWALGVILFRAVTGRLPFTGDSQSDLFVKIATEPAPAPTSIAPELLPQLDGFFTKALAKDRNHRFQTAGEMVEAFALIVRPSMVPRLSTGSLFGQVSSEAAVSGRNSLRPSTKPDLQPAAPASRTPESVSAATPPPLPTGEGTLTKPTTVDTTAPLSRAPSRWKRIGVGAITLATAIGIIVALRYKQAPAEAGTSAAPAPTDTAPQEVAQGKEARAPSETVESASSAAPTGTILADPAAPPKIDTTTSTPAPQAILSANAKTPLAPAPAPTRATSTPPSTPAPVGIVPATVPPPSTPTQAPSGRDVQKPAPPANPDSSPPPSSEPSEKDDPYGLGRPEN